MKNFTLTDPDFEKSTMIKVQLKPYDTLHGWTFVESNVRDLFDGENLMYCPMHEKQTWGDEDSDEMRIYEGLVRFFKRSDYIPNDDIHEFTKIISDELEIILNTLNKVLKEQQEFIKSQFFLSELSLVCLLNHDKKKGCVKLLAPKYSTKPKCKILEIVDSLDSFKYHVDNLQKKIEKKGTNFYGKGGCCIF